VADFDDIPVPERAVRIGAIREVWEETGILLAPQNASPARERSLRETLELSDVRLHLQSLTHFGHWVTPVEEPRRFDTHFFLAAVDRDVVAEPDGVETVDAEWLSPEHAAQLAQSGERPIIFPTMLNLLRVAESDNAAAAIAAARARPRVTVTPVMEVFEDGTRRVTIPAAAGYPVLEWPHRR
jgi:8-oxo-dGTP pyrophosphatase MutT (NUDIX family)